MVSIAATGGDVDGYVNVSGSHGIIRAGDG
ncbi:hypothetical protein SLEP1_g59267, partial [Rubroshorea leprosula]